MSDQIDAIAASLSTPAELVERSAAARAAANGTTMEEVLAAWAGGAPAAPPVATPEPVAATEVAAPVAEPEIAEPAAAVAIATPATAPEPVVIVEPEKPIDPVPLGRRLRTALRVGAWTGAALGLFGFLVATAWWAANATVMGEGPFSPVIQTESSRVVIGAALISIVFGAVTAGLSRASAGWANPGMRLSSSPSSTAWLGALLGLILGVVAGALLAGGFGSVVEGSESLVQLPVLPTLSVMVIGGALLGALTATVTQLVAVPVAVEDGDNEEVSAVRGRLGGAISIPMVSLLILVVLVLPFAWALIESNHLTANGAAIVGILTASGILGFATLAGSKPEMRIRFGDVMVAVVGIGVVLIVIFAVLLVTNSEEGHADEAGTEESAAVLVVS